MSVFGRNMLGGLDCFCEAHGKSEWKILPFIVISLKLQRQNFWYIDSMNIVFTFLCAAFTGFDFLD